MEDILELQPEKDALISENQSLKDVIIRDREALENLTAHIQAYQTTVNEVVSANIALKAGCGLLEKRHEIIKAELAIKTNLLASKETDIINLQHKISELE